MKIEKDMTEQDQIIKLTLDNDRLRLQLSELRGHLNETGPVKRSDVGTLSDRQLQVFRLLGAGKSTRDIAESLELSFKTIETYRENIKHKLSLPDASALMHRAMEWATGASAK